MKLTFILLLIACSVLAGCGGSKPTPEQTISALDKFIKQDNPGATISVSDVEEATPDYFTVHFLFTDFSFKDEKGAGQKLSSGKGSAGFSRSARGKWVLDLVTIKEPGPFKNFEPDIEVN